MEINTVYVIDCGGQYAHLLARGLRTAGVYTEIQPAEVCVEALTKVAGIVISGGPQSVTAPGSPQPDPALLDLGVPVLGICYGHQWLAHVLGGGVQPGRQQEYGYTTITVEDPAHFLLSQCGETFTAWMSHGDEVVTLPPNCVPVARTSNCTYAVFRHMQKPFYGLQFHPEVTHTKGGQEILKAFVARCSTATPWTPTCQHDATLERIVHEVGDRNVCFLVSGGVDSTVGAKHVLDVLGESRIHLLFVDTGLVRKDEAEWVQQCFQQMGVSKVEVVDASNIFLKRLKGIVDPEEKRALIGRTFIALFRLIRRQRGWSPQQWVLGQGTIYPDTIESGATKHAARIKLHHNRAKAVERMRRNGELVEPLADLYKHEVRQLGQELGVPGELLGRHPFPGPGLAVRILCAHEPAAVETRLPGVGLPHRLLPVCSVGVQGDSRTYKQAVALFSRRPFPASRHREAAVTIPNKYSSISRVVMCTSHAMPLNWVFTPTTITREVVAILQEADAIVEQELRAAGMYDQIWQCPVVLLPFGIKPNGRSIVVRPITSVDAMTAEAFVPKKEEQQVVTRITDRLLHEVRSVQVVFFDLTNKPPGTIEWE